MNDGFRALYYEGRCDVIDAACENPPDASGTGTVAAKAAGLLFLYLVRSFRMKSANAMSAMSTRGSVICAIPLGTVRDRVERSWQEVFFAVLRVGTISGAVDPTPT